MFSSTGYNWSIMPKHDATLSAVSTRYGTTTMPDTHPAIKGDIYTTTTAKTFRNPGKRSKPNWRERVKGSDFAPSRSRSQAAAKFGPASGYVVNSTLFDGTGWVPEKNLHTDMVRTEYRNRFNPAKKFHKEKVPTTSGRLVRRTLVYDRE